MHAATATRIDTITKNTSPDAVAHFSGWGHTVHGWFKTAHDIAPRPGVLLVATQAPSGMAMIDVIDADNLRQAALAHARAPQWRKHATGGVMLGVIYLDIGMSSFLSRFLRGSVASHIRSVEHPICGESDVFA